MSQTFTKDQVASHNKADSLWVIIDEDVYDLTKFQDEHPGGKKILQRVAGKDASKQFWKYHNEGILKKYKAQLQIGSLDSKKKEDAASSSASASSSSTPATYDSEAYKNAKPAKAEVVLDPYGELIPFGDPSWYQGVCHPSGCNAWKIRAEPILYRSIIPLITMPHMPPFAKKCASGWRLKSSPT